MVDMHKQRSLTLGLAIGGPILFILYLALGAISLPLDEVIAVLKYVLTGNLNIASETYPKTTAILFHIRLPRAFAGILAGSALALAGAATQGLFRNPLASPDILGISAGSSLGAVIAITTGIAFFHPLAIPVTSIVGAVFTASIVYILTLRTSMNQQLLFVILCGLALSSLLTGATSAALLIAEQYEISQFIFWTMGGLEGRLWSHVLWPAPGIIACSYLLLRQAQPLNLIALGEDNAHGMGLNVQKTQRITLLASALLTALAISIAGPVGFIGLMIPHFVRIVFGPDHRSLIPLSAFFGAAFVLLADLIGRTVIAPHEIKVGIITAMVGGSYFIYLIVRIQKRGRL
jgi:iron complex transport system permease protein